MSQEHNQTPDPPEQSTSNQDQELSDVDRPESAKKSEMKIPRQPTSYQTFIADKDEVHREGSCSDQDFVKLIASNSSVLCKTMQRWQESYNLDVNDLKEKALRLIKGDFRDLYGDLSLEEQEKIESEIARLQRERTELLMQTLGVMSESLDKK